MEGNGEGVGGTVVMKVSIECLRMFKRMSLRQARSSSSSRSGTCFNMLSSNTRLPVCHVSVRVTCLSALLHASVRMSVCRKASVRAPTLVSNTKHAHESW